MSTITGTITKVINEDLNYAIKNPYDYRFNCELLSIDKNNSVVNEESGKMAYKCKIKHLINGKEIVSDSLMPLSVYTKGCLIGEIYSASISMLSDEEKKRKVLEYNTKNPTKKPITSPLVSIRLLGIESQLMTVNAIEDAFASAFAKQSTTKKVDLSSSESSNAEQSSSESANDEQSTTEEVNLSSSESSNAPF